MDAWIDKWILLGFGFFLISGEGGTVGPVITFLMAIIAAALGLYIEEKKWMCLLFTGILVLSFFHPLLLFFFPVFLYDMIDQKIYIPAVPLLLLCFQEPPEDWQKTLFWLLTCACSVLLANKTGQKQLLSKKLIEIRDSSVELNLMLEEKNRHLLEKQDYEIHLATLKERNRIAREIHDNVGHLLSRSLLMTGALLISEKEGEVHEQLIQIKETLDMAMTSIRQSVHDLHEDSIDLRQVFHELAEPMRQDYKISLEYDMSDEIPRKIKYCLIAIVKEALSNIIKHSDGDQIRICCREHPGFYQLLIEDNGALFKEASNGGLGLQNMKERTDILKGTFRIYRKNGFGIFVSIPKTEETICG